MADSSSGSILVNIFTAPSAAFAALRERPNPWLALAIVVIGSAATSFLYMQVVDLPWMLDYQMSQAGNLTDDQRRQGVDAALQLSPTVYGVIGAVSAGLTYLIGYALIALYLTAVSFATNDGVKFGSWFAVIAWSMVPLVLGLAATFVNLLVSDVRFLPPERVNPLSFGNLLGIEGEGATTLERWLLSFSVIALWIAGLLVLGHQVLSQRSIVRSAVIVLGPIVAIVLIASVAAL